MPKPATLILKGKRSIVVTRTFDAPRAAVWDAFTDPRILRHWLAGPQGWAMHRCEVDLRVGGSYRWGWTNPTNGEEFGFRGSFAEVEPGVSFADAQRFDNAGTGAPISMLTRNFVYFEDCKGTDGPATRVITSVRYANAPTRFLVVEQGIGQGMELAYKRLDAALALPAEVAMSA